LSKTDRILLEEIQEDLPLIPQIYKYLGVRCGISEAEAIEKISRFVSTGVIREITAILNPGRLGYKSTLVAVRAERDDVWPLAEKINRHRGVSHNYLRDHKHNIWFTITIEQDKEFKDEVKNLLGANKLIDYLILPSRRTFKIRANFRFSKRREEISNARTDRSKGAARLSDFDKDLIVKLQEGLRITPRPWEEIADMIRVDRSLLLKSIRDLKDRGVIKRIAAVLRPRAAGFKANGMACFRIPDEDIYRAGKSLAGYPEVSHCYQRPRYPNWEYPLFCMVHTKTEQRCESVVREMAKGINCDTYLILYSLKEFKKETVKYFADR